LQLENYDAVLSFSPAITAIYQRDFGLPHVYTVHEAADPDLFRPIALPKEQDVVFIGNWGDNDRNETLETYLLQPSNLLPDLRFAIYGVRYGAALLERIAREYRAHYRGWVANYRAPLVYAASKMSLHLPRQQYTSTIYGTPTIRVFETLACGLPLISLPWPDTDELFCAGEDYLVVKDQAEMVEAIRHLAADPAARKKLGDSGRARILAHHTVRHRARQIIGIVDGLK
jgi:spore maturation protein CgeB